MNAYETEQIRNVVILGHGGAGKTTLVEALAYVSGVTNRMGKIADGNTISDFDKEETKRLFSIATSVVPVIHGGTKVNLLDTPGYCRRSGRGLKRSRCRRYCSERERWYSGRNPEGVGVL